MDFSLTEEQSILADSVSRFIESDYDFETRQRIVESDASFSLDMWRTFAELGWTAVPFAEEDGGLVGASTGSARPPLLLGTTNFASHSGQIPRLSARNCLTCNLCPLGHSNRIPTWPPPTVHVAASRLARIFQDISGYIRAQFR